MKHLFTILIAAVVFSTNITAQLNSKNLGSYNFVKGGLDKQVSVVLTRGDELSQKMSPLLGTFLSRIKKNGGITVKLPESVIGLKKILFFYNDELNNLILPVLIKTYSTNTLKSTIENRGGKTGTVAGDIITAEIPLSEIEQIASMPEVVYLEASTISELKLDVSRVETKVNQLHNGTGIPRAYKGNGVVVGVVDSGIDWKHQDFHNAGGNRIKYLWDMSGSGNPPSGYNYGTEYTKAQLDANNCLEKDLDDGGGHGTHVSSTAAGNGSANSNYIGMAPESDIVFVKGFRTGPGFASTDVINGCNYIFSKAQQMGKPAVINLSLGGHAGAHDGTSLYEQGLSNLTGNGKIIVAAGGNEGGETIHLSYTASGTSYNDGYETFFELGYGASVVVSDMWYNNGSISVGVAAYDTSSLQLIGYMNAVPPGQKIEDIPFTVNQYTLGYITVDATGINNPNNGGNEVIIGIDSHNGQVDLSAVYWTVYTYGSGTFDAWAIAGGQFSAFSQNWFKGGDNNKTIGIPGTSQKLLCIGSYVSKDHWIDIDGVTRYQAGNPVIGKISWFSSLGPTRDSRLKPDFVAPGEVIIAALSSDCVQVPRQNILQGGKHQKMQGTSMATPHVTGVVALLLEKNATLNYDQTVTVLKNTAIKDGFTGGTANNTYGSGKMDAYNAFLNVQGGGGGQTANLIYDDGTPQSGYFWPGANQGSANRMTPTLSNASVTKMEIYITGVNSGSAIYKPIILGSSGGAPGNDLTIMNFKTAASVPGWDMTDLTSYNISVNGDFFVGLKYDGTNQPSFGYDPLNNNRAWDYNGTAWSAWTETYFMRATISTVSSSVEISNEIPVKFELTQNYPNPFNPVSSFRISLPEAADTKVIIYDITGRKITELVNNYLNAGIYEITWNGKNDNGQSVASGAYIYYVHAGSFAQYKKMMLIK